MGSKNVKQNRATVTFIVILWKLAFSDVKLFSQSQKRVNGVVWDLIIFYNSRPEELAFKVQVMRRNQLSKDPGGSVPSKETWDGTAHVVSKGNNWK